MNQEVIKLLKYSKSNHKNPIKALTYELDCIYEEVLRLNKENREDEIYIALDHQDEVEEALDKLDRLRHGF